MGEVSRLLVASPRPRLMETFFLILFSSLIGIDVHPIPFYINIIVLIFHCYFSDDCCSVVWTLG